MAVRTSNTSGWKIKDIMMVVLIGMIFGVMFYVLKISHNAFASITKPLISFLSLHSITLTVGASQVSQQVMTAATIGLWVMAGPVSALIIKKPGSALLGELLAAIVKMAIGSTWGTTDLIWGLVQGAGSELGFALAGYKKPLVGLWFSTITSTVLSFGYNYFYAAYDKIPVNFTLSLLIIWFVSILFFAGILVFVIYFFLKRARLVK
ncbi:ECF transporter S component [Oenococcus sicerae]|uniref:Transporter n=1 Tax=Oenococcus sicerae TaxID=2203724 RepID=A0AAJ1VQF7_9LACO|nr:ECF transporter S component [Oenococcus sicerae]MDN6900142.1 transporter [Oenococcus sicerae]QAS69748.1 ECF transporter S component [Oenococcus sicerae]